MNSETENKAWGVVVMRTITTVSSTLALLIVCWLANKTTNSSDTIISINAELPHIRELITNQSARLTGFETNFATKTELENQRLKIELKQASFENEILKTLRGFPQTTTTTQPIPGK